MDPIFTALATLRTQHVPNLLENFKLQHHEDERQSEGRSSSIHCDKIQRATLTQSILYENLVPYLEKRDDIVKLYVW